MSNTADIIKGFLFQLGKSNGKNAENKIIKELRYFFNKAFEECNDFSVFMDLFGSEDINALLTCNFFPRTFDKYGCSPSMIDFSNNIEYELRWSMFCFAYYSKEISFFVDQREKYDNLILLDKYEEAKEVVDEIERKLGVSFWSIECNFYLNSKLNLNNLLSEIPRNKNAIYEAVLNFYELKNRENITYKEYSYFVKKHIKYLKEIIPELKGELEFFYYMSIPSTYRYTKKRIKAILSEVKYCSLIDQYLFFSNISYSEAIIEKNSLRTIIEKYISSLDCIQDNHLMAIRFILNKEKGAINNYVMRNKLSFAKSEFINGNISSVQDQLLAHLVKYPSDVEAINFLVEVNILFGKEPFFHEENNLTNLIHSITSIYKLDSNREGSTEYIYRLTNQCSFSSWSMSILNNLQHRCKLCDKELEKKFEILSNMQYLDIETVMSYNKLEECLDYIDKNFNSEDLYVKFRRKLLEKKYKEAINLCNVEQIKDLINIYNENESFQNKTRSLKKLRNENIVMEIRGLKIYFSEIDLKKNLDLILSLSADLVIENILFSLFLPLDKIIKLLDEGEREIRKNICSCIVYFVYAYYYNADKKEDLGIICEDFFLFENIAKPSQIEVDKYKREYLVYFLKNVCNVKVLASSICSFNNSQERDRERVDICNKLCQIDILNLKNYENEIRELTQKLMINAELRIIEENRIHVNVEGIKERIIYEYNNDYVRYKLYREYQNEKFMQIREIVNSSRFHEKESFIDHFKTLNYLTESSYRILEELIIHIRDAFVSSDEYGLNGYLSLNIRHGSLADELRSPLFRAKLNVTKDINTNEYIANEKWTELCSNEDSKIISRALTKFYLSTDEIIWKLKNKYIQVKTEDDNSEAMFDYRIYEYNLERVSSKVEDETPFEEFIDVVLNILWEITERNLNEIREIIQNEIGKDYQRAFELLKKELGLVKNADRLRELNQKINEASIDMFNVLDKICYWFNRSIESRHNDFDLDFVFKLGLETIKNIHPEKIFVAKELEKTDSEKFSGLYLKSFESIFYNLFDNIYKKAKEKRGKIVIGYKLRLRDNKVAIYLENDFDCSKDISSDMKRIEEAKRLIASDEYLERVKDEGGTGLLKIKKIIRYDLKCNPLIDFGYLLNENKFFISIEF